MADDFDDFTFDDDDFDDDFGDFGDDFGDLGDLGGDLGDDFGDDAGDTFLFDDDDFGDLSDFDDAGLGDFEEGDLPDLVIDDEGDEGAGNRTFVILAALLIFVFIIGIAAVVVLALSDDGDAELDMTRTAIADANATTFAQASQTAVQAQTLERSMTETAMAPPTATVPPTRTPTFTPSPSPTIDPTSLALTALAQPTKEVTPTPEAPEVVSNLGPQAVAQTATALAQILGGDSGGSTDTSGQLSRQQIIATATRFRDIVDQFGGVQIAREHVQGTATALYQNLEFQNLATATAFSGNPPENFLEVQETATALYQEVERSSLTATALANQNQQSSAPSFQSISFNADEFEDNNQEDAPIAQGTAVAQGPVDPEAVAQTATAYVEIFEQFPEGLSAQGVQATSTALFELLFPGQGGGFATPTPATLPNTGIFDDVGADSSSVMSILLLGLGLVGVIVVSRRLRTNINKS